ncbi:MAG: TerB family tellurite resistance protein [Vitreimonas sp.]
MTPTIMASAASAAATQPEPSGGVALALLVLIAAVAGWLGLRSMVRSLRAGRAQTVVEGKFPKYALEALVNAAKIDGRVSEDERKAVARAMAELAGPGFETAKVAPAFAEAKLSKDELVAYLAAKAGAFTREQKTALLKALLGVFAADGRFDETEHAALVDYTAAVGFDRRTAPEMLRGLTRDFARGNIT